ncbi:hypothetical protein WJX73_008570 [Symbiochloris irregularis]|uniref:ACT domain-containing protein n=1 Tax=Symbiochloris irregularis TaxID=706552 RepID=A0AAW1NVQ7_9CHLO
MDSDDDVVSVRPCSREPDNDRKREVRISCPDATGLGCDVARMLMDFALRILEGDVSTDGQWCFLVFKVTLSPGVPSRWPLLQSRLLQVCPSHATSVPLWRWHSSAKDDQPPFLLKIAAYDRRGVLHDLVQTLWEVGLQMFRARIATRSRGQMNDLFWVCDECKLLPDSNRKQEIIDAVRECLRSSRSSSITIEPISATDSQGLLPERNWSNESQGPSRNTSLDSNKDESKSEETVNGFQDSSSHSAQSGSQTPSRDRTGPRADNGSDSPSSQTPLQGRACKDATPVMPLRRLLSIQRTCSEPGKKGFLMVSPAEDPLGHPQDLEVTVDNTTSRTHSVVSVTCMDRKGLVYDLMRILKDVHVRTAYGKISTQQPQKCSIDLFVQESDKRPITDEDMQAALVERLLVTAPVDSGGRGRPRVTYDVTAALNTLRLHVHSAEVHTEELPYHPDVEPSEDMNPHAEEIHSFFIHKEGGGCLATQAEQQVVYDAVLAQLLVGKAFAR